MAKEGKKKSSKKGSASKARGEKKVVRKRPADYWLGGGAVRRLKSQNVAGEMKISSKAIDTVKKRADTILKNLSAAAVKYADVAGAKTINKKHIEASLECDDRIPLPEEVLRSHTGDGATRARERKGKKLARTKMGTNVIALGSIDRRMKYFIGDHRLAALGAAGAREVVEHLVARVLKAAGEIASISGKSVLQSKHIDLACSMVSSRFL